LITPCRLSDYFVGSTIMTARGVFSNGATPAPWYYAIYMVDEQPTVASQFDLRHIEQSVPDQSGWIMRGDASKAIISDFHVVPPRCPGTPVPWHVELICVPVEE
jgi:hypothetical protein